jgi:UDP-N-acetylmuramyl pentapeptide phosphotransferase/UDP-N-acetylglucosamine-1-phosphate transferase
MEAFCAVTEPILTFAAPAAALAALLAVAIPAKRIGLKFLLEHGSVRLNYEGNRIPTGTGLIIALLYIVWHTAVIALDLLQGWSGADTVAVRQTRMAELLLVAAVGWLDDSAGDQTVKGFSGHWSAWAKRKTVTTGALKACGISVAALWVAFEEADQLLEGLVGWLAIVLSANAVNLLDVRPGRAWKGFLAGSALLLAAVRGQAVLYWFAPALAAALVLFPGDLRGKHMLGDSGANLLGFILGCAVCAYAPLPVQLFFAAMLAAMHRIAEKSSITEWIERHKWIRWFDRIGRV